MVAVGLVLGLLVWSEFETRIRQDEIKALLDLESEALVEALGHAAEHTLASAREIEELASARLLDQARLLDRLDAAGKLGPDDLEGLASELTLKRIVVIDRALVPVLQFHTAALEPAPAATPELSALAPLAQGEADEMIFTAREDLGTGDAEFAAAVRRTRGGAILVVMDALQMLSFQESVGAVNLMQGVVETGGILYALLETSDGDLVAGVRHPPAGETGEILELTREVDLAHGEPGRLRLGLSAEPVAAVAAAGRRRAVVAALLTFVLAAASVGYVLARRRAAVLRGESTRARSLTDAVLEGVGDAVLVTDPQSVIQMVNPAACALFGRRGSDLVGRRCDDTPCAQVRQVVEDSGVRELVLHLDERPPVPVLASVSPVRDEEGNLFGTAVLLRDLSEVKKLEREARRTESLAAFGRLAAAVAHEVRNPLNAIALGVQRLEREYPPAAREEEHGRLTAVLRTEVERLDGIVGRLLDLARPPRLVPRPGDLAAAVRDMIPLLSSGLPPGVRLVEEAEVLPSTLFDPAAVRQVVHNLVRNATEAMTGEGTIRIATRPQGQNALLEVADDGPGIPPEDLERIFELGFSTKTRGNGLGLPIVHRLVTEMGGRIAIDSELRRGTTVRVMFPFAAITTAS